MDKNTFLLQDTEAFMRGELDNVTVAGGSIVLDLVQGSYVPYGCYTSAPIPMPLFDALWPSWNAATPPGTAVETQVRVLVDGNWTAWMAFGKWSLYLKREGAAPRERGPLQLMPDCLLLDSKCATQVQLRIYLYSKNEKATPAVHLLGATVRMVDVIPSGGRPVNRTLHLMPYLQKRRAPVLAPWMDLAISLASLTNRWGADILPEEFAQALRDWRKPDGCDCRNLGFAAAAAGSWGFPAWLCWGGLNILRDEMRKGYGAVVALQATPAEKEHGLPDRRFAAVRGFVAGASAPQVLLCDPWADGTDFDAETAMPLDDFLVAWDNVALLMRRRLEEQPAWAPTHGSAWIRPVGTDAPGIYRLYVNGEEHPIPDDFCALGGLLAWTIYNVLRDQTPGQLAHALVSADWRFLLIGVALMAAFVAFEARSSHLILRALGTPQPYRRCYLYSSTGFFFSNITPSATGGQPAQIYYMNRDGVPVAHGAIDMLLVTIGYHTAIMIFGVLSLVLCPYLPRMLGGEVGFLLGLGFSIFFALNVAMILFLFLPGPARRICRWAIGVAVRARPSLDREKLEKKLEEQLDQYAQGARLIRATPGLLPQVLLMSMGQLACSYAVPYIIYLAFHLTGSSFVEVFALQVLCSISVGYLPLPGAAGAAENVFLRGFAAVFGAGLIAPAMILSRTVSCYLVLIVTGIITALLHFRGRKNAPADTARQLESQDLAA